MQSARLKIVRADARGEKLNKKAEPFGAAALQGRGDGGREERDPPQRWAYSPLMRNFGDGVEGKLLPRAPPCVLCVGKVGERRSTRMSFSERAFSKPKVWPSFLLSLRTIFLRYDADENTSIGSGAEGGCFAKGNV